MGYHHNMSSCLSPALAVSLVTEVPFGAALTLGFGGRGHLIFRNVSDSCTRSFVTNTGHENYNIQGLQLL